MTPPRGGIAKAAKRQAQAPSVSECAAKAFGLSRVLAESYDANGKGSVYVVLKYFEPTFECLSAWTTEQLRSLSDLIVTLRGLSWDELHQHGGIRPKQINLRTIACGDQILARVKDQLSPEISFIELRVNRAVRVHGFRVEDAFFLVLLDREHRVYPD